MCKAPSKVTRVRRMSCAVLQAGVHIGACLYGSMGTPDGPWPRAGSVCSGLLLCFGSWEHSGFLGLYVVGGLDPLTAILLHGWDCGSHLSPLRLSQAISHEVFRCLVSFNMCLVSPDACSEAFVFCGPHPPLAGPFGSDFGGCRALLVQLELLCAGHLLQSVRLLGQACCGGGFCRF